MWLWYVKGMVISFILGVEVVLFRKGVRFLGEFEVLILGFFEELG